MSAKPVLVIGYQPSCTPGTVASSLDERGVEWRFVRAWEVPRLPAADDGSAVILLGGEMNADYVHEFPALHWSRSLVLDAIGIGIPVLGICLGSQVMARALGATVRPGAAREIGFMPFEGTGAGLSDPVLAPLGTLEAVFQWHEDAFEVPQGADLLYRSRLGPQAFRLGRMAYGVQCHFEVTEKEIRAWCAETPAEELRGVWGATETVLLEQAGKWLPRQERVARDVILRFLDLRGA